MTAGSPPHATLTGETRKPRSDARRNRARILDAAAYVFSRSGAEGRVGDIAARAGLGQGTLFRHFPSKQVLLIAVLGSRIDNVLASARDCIGMSDPWSSVKRFMTEGAEQLAHDRAFLQAIGPGLFDEPELQSARDELLLAVDELLVRAQDAGVVRRDLSATDIPFLLNAVGGTIEHVPCSDPELWRRYLLVVLDGMRPAGATPLTVAAPVAGQLPAVMRGHRFT